MKQILYVMMFKEVDYLKIGITKDLNKRMEFICRQIDKNVDHYESYILEANNDNDIRPLEKYLHRITIKDKFTFDSDIKIDGKHEFRDKKCLLHILSFIEDQKKYGLKYDLFKGIDICGTYGHKIPKAYYPPDIKCNDQVSITLVNDIEDYCNKSNINFIQFINGLLYEKAQELNIERKDGEEEKLFKNYYKVRTQIHH